MKIIIEILRWIGGILVLLSILGIIAGFIYLSYHFGYGLGVKGFLILPIIVSGLSLLGITLSWSSYANMGFASTLAFVALPILTILIELPFYGMGLAIDNVQFMSAIMWGIFASLPFLLVIFYLIVTYISRTQG